MALFELNTEHDYGAGITTELDFTPAHLDNRLISARRNRAMPVNVYDIC